MKKTVYTPDFVRFKLLLPLFLFLSIAVTNLASAQTATVTGIVRDKTTQQLLPGVNIVLENAGQTTGTTSDENGVFKLSAAPGSYTITASFVGYKPVSKFNVLLTSGNVNAITFEMDEDIIALDEVTVDGNKTAAVATIETPVSIQRLTTEEIRSNPGGNFDISRVIQALPGVGGSTGGASFRNDIIIRGGAPNENVYYLDGIEIPVLNHFSTQGSAGGPQGILNVSFIEDVTLSSSAFEARYDNVLSSVLQFRQREGNAEKFQGNFRLSATELALTTDGPINKKTTALFSARRSYLKLLFELIDLPIRPDYWDFQTKITHRLNSKTTLSLLGIGAIDRFKFAVPEESTPENTYILRSNPLINQESYAIGASMKRLVGRGFFNVALSRNALYNRLDKYEDATQPVESERTLKVASAEIENKLRFDLNKVNNNWKYAFGALVNYVQFDNNVFNLLQREVRDLDGNVVQPALSYTYDADLNMLKAGAFAQVSRQFQRISLSAGIRTDVNSFTQDGMNPLKTLSPRLGLSFMINEKWNINTSVGSYYKLPVYTMLGFQDNENFINKNLSYIRSNHYVAGVEFLPASGLRFTVEGFLKQYSNYPVALRNGVSTANTGTQFGQVGNEPLASVGEGRAYGVEFFAQQKLTRNTFFTLSYTLFKSEFTNQDGRYASSSWDNRSLVSAIFGRKLPRNWELGLKFRYAGGSPYTPFDLAASQRNYLTLGEGVPDYTQLNGARLGAFYQLDLRIDKKWNFKSTTIDVFIDLQNVTNANPPGALSYTFQRNADNSDFATTDGNSISQDGSNAIPLILKDSESTLLPTLGFIIEF